MARRALVVLLLLAGTWALVPPAAHAHAGLLLSDPPEGSAFDPPPTEIRLTFTEAIEPSLSTVDVTDDDGASMADENVRVATDDPLTLLQPVGPLSEGVYTVRWRVISRVDGHASSGRFVFGVGVLPSAVMQLEVAEIEQEVTGLSPLEVVGRSLLLGGLVVLLGVTVAGAAGRASAVSPVASLAWGASVVGLAVLAESQRRAAAVSMGALLATSIGGALVVRGVAVGAAGLGLAVVRWGPPGSRRPAMGAVAGAATLAMMTHVSAGHAAAAEDWVRVLNVGAQWAHVAAAGVWIGGLVALLITVRGTVSGPKAATVRRFSRLAGPAFAVVVSMGIVRTLREVTAWSELVTTGYGRVVLAKLAFTGVILVVAAFNRYRSVPMADRTLRPLRLASGGELTVIAVTIMAAAALAGLSPPAAIRAAQPPSLTTTGEDFGRTMRVELTARPGTPGANRFIVHVTDPQGGESVPADSVTLQFRSLDDPFSEPSVLEMVPGDDGAFVATGTNLQFDATWQIRAFVTRSASRLDVPLELEVPGRPQQVSVFAVPGEPVVYTVDLAGGVGLLEITPAHQEPGTTQLRIRVFDPMTEPLGVEHLRLTVASPGSPPRTYPIDRVNVLEFSTQVEFQPGVNVVTVVGTTTVGIRFRGSVELIIDG